MTGSSAIEELEEELKRRVALIRRNIDSQVGPIEELLKSYRSALEAEHCREFTSAHSLRSGRTFTIAPEAAARALLRAVSDLPENRKRAEGSASAPPPEAREETLDAPSTPPPESEKSRNVPSARTIHDVLPKLVEAADRGKIVVVGAFAGRAKELPSPLESSTEWIDTARDGVHAIGNLPQRIRRGGIAALILCEQIVAHQHTEPLVQAARTHSVPIGFAGKGGSLGISRALEAIEAQLP